MYVQNNKTVLSASVRPLKRGHLCSEARLGSGCRGRGVWRGVTGGQGVQQWLNATRAVLRMVKQNPDSMPPPRSRREGRRPQVAVHVAPPFRRLLATNAPLSHLRASLLAHSGCGARGQHGGRVAGHRRALPGLACCLEASTAVEPHSSLCRGSLLSVGLWRLWWDKDGTCFFRIRLGFAASRGTPKRHAATARKRPVNKWLAGSWLAALLHPRHRRGRGGDQQRGPAATPPRPLPIPLCCACCNACFSVAALTEDAENTLPTTLSRSPPSTVITAAEYGCLH